MLDRLESKMNTTEPKDGGVWGRSSQLGAQEYAIIRPRHMDAYKAMLKNAGISFQSVYLGTPLHTSYEEMLILNARHLELTLTHDINSNFTKIISLGTIGAHDIRKVTTFNGCKVKYGLVEVTKELAFESMMYLTRSIDGRDRYWILEKSAS